jgi:subtilisin family serine protease
MRLFPYLVAVSLALLGCESQTSPHTQDTPSTALRGGRTFVTGTRLLKSEKPFPGRYIVVLDDKATLKAPTQGLVSELARLHGAEVGHVYEHGLPGFVAKMPEARARLLSLDPRVKYVEEDGRAVAAGEQTTPPWNIDRVDQRALPLSGNYSYGRSGKGVHVYVLDTGIYTIHSELLGRAHTDFNAVYDYRNELDCHGHGTHMAGIIGGKTYGVAKGVELHSVRTLGCDGAGYWSDFIRGISWVNANHHKPAAVNISVTGVGSEALEEAITRSIQDFGITYVVSAGNREYGGGDACHATPARTPAAITVGATDSTDTRYSSSNYGSCVDLFAPGKDITSAWREYTHTLSGSSAAAAHVTGAVALYLEANPTATPEQVTQALLSRATPDAVWNPGPGSPNRLLYIPCKASDGNTPPQIALTAPASGAALSGSVTLTATATDDVGVTKVEFYHGTHLLGTDTSAPYELAWDTATASNGPGTLTARAYDDTCGLTASAAVDVTIQNAGNADFDPQRMVPACATVGSRCDSVWLLEGRAVGYEPHAPNTLGGTCADGTRFSERFSPALDRLAVIRSDGSAFAPGKEVTIQATARAGHGGMLSLYSAPDASNPTWTLIKSFSVGGPRHQVVSTPFLLPAGGLQAIRGVYQIEGSAQPCNTDYLTGADHDDLVFAVGQETDSAPPTVAITSPVAGTVVEATLAVGVTASDNFGVARVELYRMDGALIGTDTTPPFSVAWNTKGLPNGPHSLTARAYDAAGLSTTSAPVELIINNDLVPPQVAFLAPSEGAAVNGYVDLRATASDDRGQIDRVEYFRSYPPSPYNTMGSSSTPPYSVSWNTRGNLANGPRQFYVRATDAAGNTTLSGPLNVVIDNDYTKPTVAITSPAADETVSGGVSLQASASDDRQISSVTFYVDGRWLGNITSAPYSMTWDSAGETNGSHTVTATAYDAQGNSAISATVTVTLNNASGSTYDPLLKAPRCAAVADSCNSGRLLQGRGPTETNAPNNLDACADGNSTNSSLPYIERIRVSRPDGTALAVGKRVRIDVSVVSYDANREFLDLYYTGDASQRSWTYLTTLKPSASGAQTLTAEYRLPAGSVQAVRANYQMRYQSTPPSACSTGTQDDHDDLVFPVGTEPDTTAPSVALTSPAPGTVLTGMATATATATDDFDVTQVEFYEGTTLLGTDDTAPYSVTWNSWHTPNGVRALTAVARDAAGNVSTSSPMSVEVNNDHASLLTTITSPSTGATLAGTVTISATVGNRSKVRDVQFLLGTRVIGYGYSYPAYTMTWDTTAEPVGEHTLTARTYDWAGNSELSAPVHVTIVRDTTPPTVALTSPAAGATVSGVVDVTSAATDNMAMGRVELYVNGSLKSTGSSAPYTVGWDTRPLANGSYTLMLKAFDTSGNMSTSSEVTVTVDNDKTAPTVSLTAPTNGSAVSGMVTISANASDNQSVRYVIFHVDGVLQAYDFSAPYTLSWNSRNVTNGAHTLTVKAYDSADNEGTASITVTVDNDYTAPTTALTSPAPGATVAGMVSLQASASDSHGVTKVEFFVGGTRVATVTAPPYVASWDSHAVMNGSHVLTTKAYDAAGNSSTSAPVTVAVAQPGSAVYDATLRVPVCAQISSVCDSTALLQGRGPYSGPEPHHPNTLDGCADGSSSSADVEQIRWIKVSNADGAPLATYRRVRVDVAVQVGSSPSVHFLDLYFASNAAAPSWTYLTTLQASASGLQILSAEYVLPIGSLQAVRANFRFSGSSPSPCSSGYRDDHDDLVFAVDAPVDVTPPTAAITAPASNDQLGGTVTVTATAEDDFSVARVEFYDGQTLVGTDTSEPYSASWNTTGAMEGAHTLTVKAYDSAGLVGTSAAVTVIVDNTAPTVAFSAPAQSALLRGTVQVTATASDNQAISRVEFYEGTTLLGTATTAPYAVSWDSTASPSGSLTLRAKAYDLAGNVQQISRAVTVDNAAPTVAITSPAPGAKIGLSVTIQASASDNLAVTQVVFYDGAKVIGTDTTAPYSVSWSTLLQPKGQHTLTARAHDSAGNVTTSAGVIVTVQ